MTIKSRRPVIAALFAISLAASGPLAGGTQGQAWIPGFVLVRAGRPACVIVLPPGASPADRRAAEILRESVRRMTGAELPIVAKAKPVRDGEIWIGYGRGVYPDSFRRAVSRLKPGGFLDVVSTRAVYIVSGGGKGSIYGVVHLLEKYFGCRKFSPTADFFPSASTLALGRVFDLDNPVNDFRCVNGDFIQDPDYRDWMRLDGTDEMFAKGYYVHTFNRLLPWTEFFADHSDYYALMNGKRIIDQLCPSRPEVFDILAQRLEKEMAAQPDKKVWSVSQNDNFSYCRCPDCLKIIAEEGSPAGPILRLVNRLAARFPDRTISTLAYQFSRPAPRVTKPAANVQIMLCTIELNRSRPIAEDPSSASFVRDIEAWSRLTKNLFLWDYTVDFAHQVSPFPNLHVLQPNLRFFVRHGARAHFQQTNTSPGHEFSELKGWLLAKLLWNPELDVDATINDFLAGYYGAAAPFIRHIIDSYRDGLAASGAALDIYEPPNAHADDFLAAEKVALYDSVFDLAEKAVEADAERLRRVRAARLPLQYAALEIGKADMFGPRGFYAENQGRFEPRPEKSRLLDAFFTSCLDAGVRALNESGLTPKAYYDSVRRFIDVQVEGNLAFRRRIEADPTPAAKYGRGDPALLTNGVRGAGDFKVHWLGWEGTDFSLRLDLGEARRIRSIALSTLYDPKSWIFHPRRVTCEASADGAEWRPIGATEIDGDQRSEELTRNFEWAVDLAGVRFVRFRVEGTKANPRWHPSAGGASWVFVDEIVVR